MTQDFDISVRLEVQVICQSDAMSGSDRGNFVLDIAEESSIGNAGWLVLLLLGNRTPGVEGPFLALVAEDERTACVLCRKDDDKRTKHVLPTRCILVRLEERSFICARNKATVNQDGKGK